MGMQTTIIGTLENSLLASNDPTREMKTYVHIDLYMNIHSSIIHNGPKLETIQMSINWQVKKQNVVYTPVE